MSEYEEKIKELKSLQRWFNDHKENIAELEDTVVIYVMHGELVSAYVAGNHKDLGARGMDLVKHMLDKTNEYKEADTEVM